MGRAPGSMYIGRTLPTWLFYEGVHPSEAIGDVGVCQASYPIGKAGVYCDYTLIYTYCIQVILHMKHACIHKAGNRSIAL